MAEDIPYDSRPTIHPEVQRELNHLAGDCERRHIRSNEAILAVSKRGELTRERCEANQMALIEVVGRDGKNGKLGAMSQRQDKIEGRLDRMATRTAGGAIAGGGAVAGLIEALRVILGG